MPELPEVETVVRQLDQVLPGRVIGGVEVLREKSAQNDLNRIVGKKIARVTRKQKMIVMEFEEWDERLVVHLKMTGQIIFIPTQDDPPSPRLRKGTAGQLIFDQKLHDTKNKLQTNSKKQDNKFQTSTRVVGGHPSVDWVGELPSSHTRIIISFTDDSVLFFNDQRVFGWMKVVTNSKFKTQISKLPPDVVDEEFTVEYLSDVLNRSRRAVKLVILDQQKMGGMGNIYANDALWLAKINPTRPANKVKKKEVKLLHDAMVETLHKAIRLGGSSYSDFVDTEGLGGKYQDEFLVYDKEGEECQREECDGVIEKIKVGARGTYYCPVCQR